MAGFHAGFHEVVFPLGLALGASGGPQRRVEIVTLGSGREARNAPHALSRRRWNAGVGVKTLDDLHTLLAFFEARRGALYGFRWRDPVDFSSCAPSQTPGPFDQVLGTGDGVETVFALQKTYADAGGATARPIVKPVTGTVRVAVGGVELATDAFAVDAATGRVTLDAPPAAGVTVTAGFRFHTPVRFDVERLEITLDAFAAGAVPSAPVVELIGG